MLHLLECELNWVLTTNCYIYALWVFSFFLELSVIGAVSPRYQPLH